MDEKRLLGLSLQTLNHEDYASMENTEEVRMEDLGAEDMAMRASIHERMLIELVTDGQVDNVEKHLQVHMQQNDMF